MWLRRAQRRGVSSEWAMETERVNCECVAEQIHVHVAPKAFTILRSIAFSYSLSLSLWLWQWQHSCFADCKCEGFAHCISIYMANLFRLALGNGRQTSARLTSLLLCLSLLTRYCCCFALLCLKGLVMVLLYNCTCCCCCRRHETRNGRRKFVKLLAYLNLNEP